MLLFKKKAPANFSRTGVTALFGKVKRKKPTFVKFSAYQETEGSIVYFKEVSEAKMRFYERRVQEPLELF